MAWNSKDSEGFISGKTTSIYASSTTQNFNQLKADLLYWRSYRSMSNPSSTVGNVTSQQKTDNNQINGLVAIATYGSDNLRYQSASGFPSFSVGDGDRILEDHYNKIKLQINDLKNLVGCSSCSTTCSYDCSVTCGDSCTSGCSSGCSRTCDSSCSGNCYSGCSGCQGSCDGGCKGCGGCDGSCSGSCSGNCNGCGGCGGCGGRCGDGCGSSCAGNGCGSSG